MTLLNNPPQPVPTPIRNFVSYEDRVSVLLNRAGSTLLNPIVGTNKQFVTGATILKSGAGASLLLKFGMADTSETISAATTQEVDGDGNAVGSAKSIKALFTKDTTNMVFSATLLAGNEGYLNSGATAKKSIISIQTNLNRHINQQVYVADAPTNIVLLRSTATTQENPLRYVSANTIDGTETFTIPVSFFPTWNDEAGRQHGASGVGIKENIMKPYGGMKTVDAYFYSGLQSAGTVAGVLLEETEIENVSGIDFLPPTSGTQYNIVFRFRSKAGSANKVLGFGHVKFEDCVSGSESPDIPPIDSGGGGGVIVSPPTVPIDPEGYGTDSSGGANTGFRYVLTGYKGGVANTGGTANPIANVASGTQTFDFPSEPLGSKNLTITGALLDAELIIAEIQNEAGTVKGNSVIYTTADTDTADLPSPPTIATPTFNFTSKTASVTVTDFGWASTDATIHCQSIYSGIEVLTGTQTSSHTFADLAGSTTLTASFPAAAVPATIADLGFSFSTVPAVVAIWASNSYGRSNVFLIEDTTKVPGAVKTGPTLSAFSLATTSTTDDSIQFTISSLGGQIGNFTVHYAALPANGSSAITGSVSGAVTTNQQTIKMASGSENVDGWYYFYVAGEQGNSNTMFVSNVAV